MIILRSVAQTGKNASKRAKNLFLKSIIKMLILAAGLGSTASASGGAGYGFSGYDLSGQDRSGWSYEGATGPQNWGKIPGNMTCANGSMQSPIDLEGAEAALVSSLVLDYQVTALSVFNTGQGLTFAYEKGSALHVGTQKIPLLGFVIHTPAEHMIKGKSFAAEIQFLHQSGDGKKAIVSVLVNEGKALRAADELIGRLPLDPGQNSLSSDILINGRDLAPSSNSGYYRYMGSLTTPPCVEGVSWYILKEPITMSADQIKAFQAVIGVNNRPVQPRGNRILIDGEGLK